MQERKDYLDAIKGWAILMTILVHSRLWESEKVSAIVGAGARGCQLFFVLSGLLIFQSYDRMIQNSHPTIKTTIEWYGKRLIRLIPLWYLSILIHMLTGNWSSYWLGSAEHVTVGNILSHIVFLHGLNPYYMDSIISVEWYIGVIAIFILLMPLLYKLTANIASTLGMLIFTNVLLNYGVDYIANLNPLPEADFHLWFYFARDFGFWNQIPVLLIGVLLYQVKKEINISRLRNKRGLSVVLLLFSLMMQYGLVFHGNHLWMMSEFTLWGLAFAVLICSQAIYPQKVICNPFTKVLGKYSYGIYLFHYMIVIRYYTALAPTLSSEKLNSIVRYVVVIAISLVLSIVLTERIDKPCTNILNAKWKGIFHGK